MGLGREGEPPAPREEQITELAGAYAQALLFGDEVAAEVAVREAMEANLTSAEIDERMIAPALWLVGELWEQGRLTVADEHLATEISLRVVALQREVMRVAQSRRGHLVMLAAPAGEQHVVALRMVENLLRARGYDVAMLGPDVPPGTLGDVAERHRAAVVCMTSTMPNRMDVVLTAIDEVREHQPSAGFVLGGQGVTAEERLRPQVHVCRRVSEAVEAVDAMVQRAGLN